jgi:hypothetical protein
MIDSCLVCEGTGEIFPSGMCGGCDAERMDAEERGYAVSIGNGRVFCALYISLATWNGFVMPSFARDDAVAVLEYYGHTYTFTNEGWVLQYTDDEGYTVISERTRDGLYPIGSGSWMWERVEVSA